MAKVARVGEHLLWVGQVSASGYGSLKVGRRKVAAHRAAYEAWVGAIPEGYHVHHACGIARCINPKHLRAVVPEEHKALHPRTKVARGRFSKKDAARLLVAMHQVGIFDEKGQLVPEVRKRLEGA